MSTHTTTTIWKQGVKYPPGTPIEDLPEVVRNGLTAVHVADPAALEVAKPKTRRARRTKPPVAEPPASATTTPPASDPAPGDQPIDDPLAPPDPLEPF